MMPSKVWPRFTAVVLAGGQGRRMGRDKAWLEYRGRPLLAYQLETLRRLGAEAVRVSCRREAPYREFGAELVYDGWTNLGPLAGLTAALEACASPLLLVLAVDLPAMTAGYLRKVLAQCAPGRGVVPVRASGWEPLAACYPRAALAVARAMLLSGTVAVRQFAGVCVSSGLAQPLPVRPSEEARFRNWNHPRD